MLRQCNTGNKSLKRAGKITNNCLCLSVGGSDFRLEYAPLGVNTVGKDANV